MQEHQRERLVKGMVEAVFAKGYPATSVADVLSLARVSRSVFYEQFKDKEDCFLACYDRGTTLVFGAVSRALEEGGAWAVRMRRVFDYLTAVFVENPELARVCMIEALGAGPAANLRYRAALATLVAIVEGDIASDPDAPRAPSQVIFGLVGGCSALIYEEIAEGRTTDLSDKADELTRFWLAGVLGYETIVATGRLT